jgi:hypothetical protein
LRAREILRGHAAQVARMRGIVIGASTMQRTAVVPDHQIADAPSMAMDEFALCRA